MIIQVVKEASVIYMVYSVGCYHFKRMTIYRNIPHCSGRKEGRAEGEILCITCLVYESTPLNWVGLTMPLNWIGSYLSTLHTVSMGSWKVSRQKVIGYLSVISIPGSWGNCFSRGYIVCGPSSANSYRAIYVQYHHIIYS